MELYILIITLLYRLKLVSNCECVSVLILIVASSSFLAHPEWELEINRGILI